MIRTKPALFISEAPTQEYVRTVYKVPITQFPGHKQMHSPDNDALPSTLSNSPAKALDEPINHSILAPTDMPSDMLLFATETAIKAVTSFVNVSDMAEYMRMKFESKFMVPPAMLGNWQASVGTNFASSVSPVTRYVVRCV